MIRFQTRTLLIPVIFSMLAINACQKAEEPVPTSSPVAQEQSQAESWEHFVTRQIEAHIAAHPQWAVSQGRHEYDGRDQTRGTISVGGIS
jgi:hypothetical protein